MKSFIRPDAFILALLLICSFSPLSLNACDDTLVMLLTSQNPASEFSKAIRSFTNALTNLGSAIKTPAKENFDIEMNQVMDAWLEFSTRYMTNPPEEARNDRQWQQKTSDTARFIGDIRKLVKGRQFTEAHEKILDLSGRIGMFFESFGVSDEKQLFIKASANLTSLERLILISDYASALKIIPDIKNNLDEFKKMLSESFHADFVSTERLIAAIETGINKKAGSAALDSSFQELKTAFEALRSHILMREWFPALNQKKQEN